MPKKNLSLPKNWADLDKEEKIEVEKRRIRTLLRGAPKEKTKAAERLIEQAAYMVVLMEECKALIDEQGAVVKMQQGDYEIQRENPAVKIYNTTAANYMKVMSQITGLLPEGKEAAREQAGEKLVRFVAKGKTGSG
jgi:hypothetical protein